MVRTSTLVIALGVVLMFFPEPITSVLGLVVIAIGVGLRLFG
ncbi:MAG: transporter [Halobacteriales archaeon SW_9_67_24]|jgi:dipeptide/tripeptide permease|nr:MAG: transporter [Halobacteriales archaeon SW_9_67_24]